MAGVKPAPPSDAEELNGIECSVISSALCELCDGIGIAGTEAGATYSRGLNWLVSESFSQRARSVAGGFSGTCTRMITCRSPRWPAS